jgi:hypothetical protein
LINASGQPDGGTPARAYSLIPNDGRPRRVVRQRGSGHGRRDRADSDGVGLGHEAVEDGPSGDAEADDAEAEAG